MKIAAVKALAALNDPELEHDLIIASKDNNWLLHQRVAVLKSSIPHAIKSVEATKTRTGYARPQRMLKTWTTVHEIESILNGYDRYAADAVKYSLYRKIDIRSMNKHDSHTSDHFFNYFVWLHPALSVVYIIQMVISLLNPQEHRFRPFRWLRQISV